LAQRLRGEGTSSKSKDIESIFTEKCKLTKFCKNLEGTQDLFMFIYLDESGDLGFKFDKKGTSKYFIITLLILRHSTDVKIIAKGVSRTIKNKIRKNKKYKEPTCELKGSKTSLAVKKYFYKQIQKVSFEIYAVILNKERVYEPLRMRKPKLYNFIAKFILEKCKLSDAPCGIEIVVDKSKGPEQQKDFNQYLTYELQVQIPSNIPLRIYHNPSYENKGLQAADMFCWGIARKWEQKDLAWYNCFKEKIKMEELYLPPQKP